MRALILLHRWLGVASCLLFAMWFASGIVMHFVPFPALTEEERVGGLANLQVSSVAHGPAAAVTASGLSEVRRVRLLQRVDGPVYLVMGRLGTVALRAADLSSATVPSPSLAQAIAADYARRRHLENLATDAPRRVRYDQWTVTSRFDAHRPLYRIALDDSFGTQLHVSSTTGEIVLETTRRQRVWNYVGSVSHWIYLTALRRHAAAWQVLVWWLSLLALVGSVAGAMVGTARIKVEGSRPVSPYFGLQAWHHWLGLICMPFVIVWIFSGWLSMDDGRLFSTGKPSDAEVAVFTGASAWAEVSDDALRRIGGAAKEVEWFAFGGRIYRRERLGFDRQLLFVEGAAPGIIPTRSLLRPDDIDRVANELMPSCKSSFAVNSSDAYAVASIMPNAPVFRLVCGDAWFHIDGASGELLERLDPSGRLYRWLYGALHTLDFSALTSRPTLRTAVIVILCGSGLAFSLTGVVLAGRRLFSSIRRGEKA